LIQAGEPLSHLGFWLGFPTVDKAERSLRTAAALFMFYIAHFWCALSFCLPSSDQAQSQLRRVNRPKLRTHPKTPTKPNEKSDMV